MLYLRHFPAEGAPLIGGTATAVAGLANGLAENGAHVCVLCEGETRRTTRLAAGWEVQCFARNGGARSFRLGLELQRYVIDHLHARDGLCVVNGMFHPGAYALGKFLHRAGLPYLVAPHDPYEPAVFQRNGHLKWPYWYLFERPLLNRAHAVQVLDRRHGRFLHDLGVRTRVIETPNGIEPDAALPKEALAPPAVAGAVRAVFLGRLDAYNKGLDVLLEAMASVVAQAPLQLTLQGPDWGDRSRLQRRARALGLASRVGFRGPDYARTPLSILGEHDVLCLPSRFEGFGLVALEAMLAARVLLVSERAGIARHVEACEAGVLVAPSVHDVARGLRTLLAQRARWPGMGRRARRYALEHLRWRDIGAAALADYERVLH